MRFRLSTHFLEAISRRLGKLLTRLLGSEEGSGILLGPIFQICEQYSWIVLSEENLAQRATLVIAMRAHSF